MDDFIENLETLTLDNNNLPQTDDKTQVANPEFVKSNVRGTIKFYTEDKKYGYITREDGKGDIYVSEKEISMMTVPGLLVQFDVMRGSKGIYAVDLHLI